MTREKTLKVKLVNEGDTVVHTTTRAPLAFGVEYVVPNTMYWQRRLRDGSIELCDDSEQETD